MAVREISWDEVLKAGTVIFGQRFSAAARSGGWHGELKAAYRRRALETHPDRAQHLGRSEAELAAEFRSVAAAYALLAATRTGAAPRPPAGRAAPRPERSSTSQGDEPRRPRAERTARPDAPRAQGRGTDRSNGSGPRTANTWTAGARTAGPETASEPAAFAGRLWRAGLPSRRLRLAEFLYYSGRLPWADFVAAISWQRRQRPEVGRIAVDFGFLERHQVLEILTRRRIEQALAVPFGEFAVRHGYLTSFQVLAVLGQQLRLERPLGQYFVERGLVSEPELDEARLRVLRHNARWAA